MWNWYTNQTIIKWMQIENPYNRSGLQVEIIEQKRQWIRQKTSPHMCFLRISPFKNDCKYENNMTTDAYWYIKDSTHDKKSYLDNEQIHTEECIFSFDALSFDNKWLEKILIHIDNRNVMRKAAISAYKS